MSEFLFFIIGLLIGGLGGVTVMCLLQINHLNKEDDYEKTKYSNHHTPQ